MRVIFIRHGQSRSNAGLHCDDFAQIPLTELGEQQAHALAASWTEAPSLIVVSPYLRTQQTAAPTISRFPGVPVEVWPIHEFTNLHADRWRGDLESKWREEQRQWATCDPEYTDGLGTESFSGLHDRATHSLKRFTHLQPDALVYAFSHGYFMHAVRLAIEQPELEALPRMRFFQPDYDSRFFHNTHKMPLQWNGSRWTFLEGANT